MRLLRFRRIGGCGEESMKYPTLEIYMLKHEISLRQFADRCGIPPSTMCRLLNGQTDPTKTTIDKILIETGMTYEQCFRESIHNIGCNK